MLTKIHIPHASFQMHSYRILCMHVYMEASLEFSTVVSMYHAIFVAVILILRPDDF